MRHTSLMLVGVAAAVISISPASATILITGDPGGAVIAYVERFLAARASGEPVIIDGPCLSACTLAIGILPRGQVCATPKAVLGFHAAWRQTTNGGRRRDRPPGGGREGCRAPFSRYRCTTLRLLMAWVLGPLPWAYSLHVEGARDGCVTDVITRESHAPCRDRPEGRGLRMARGSEEGGNVGSSGTISGADTSGTARHCVCAMSQFPHRKTSRSPDVRDDHGTVSIALNSRR
jgi:hypothetical protein